MLEVFLQTYLTFFICSIIGLGITKTLRMSFENPVKSIFIGAFTVAIMARLWHFLFPVNNWLILTLVSCCLLICIRFRADCKKYFGQLADLVAINWILIVLSSICLIYLASLTSISYDDGLYHAQYIRFLNKYPEVKGLANLHGRFGFNSNWHLLSAVFNGYGLWTTEANCINTFLVISFILYFCWESKKRGNYQFAISFIVFPVILIYHFIDPSADLVIILFSFALFIDLLEENYADAVFWFIAFPFLITVKINAAILCPAIIYLAWKVFNSRYAGYKKDIRNILLFTILLTLPWLFSNIVLSGYLIYPYVKLPILNLQWTVPSDQVGKELMGIKYTPLIRWSGISYAQASRMSKISQLQLWWHSTRIVEKLIVSTFIASGIFGLVLSIGKRAAVAVGLLLMLLITSIFLVPDLRFFAGFGFAAVFVLLVSLKHFQIFIRHQKILLFVLCAQCFLTVVMYVHLFHIVWKKNDKIHLFNLITKVNYQYGKYSAEEKKGVTIYYPLNNEFCWDICPCALEKNTKLRFIGEDIQYGFYQVDDLSEKNNITYKPKPY